MGGLQEAEAAADGSRKALAAAAADAGGVLAAAAAERDSAAAEAQVRRSAPCWNHDIPILNRATSSEPCALQS